MKHFLFFILAILLASPAYAGGRGNYGPYVGASISGQQLMETEVNSSNQEVTFDLGYGGSAFAGYHWPVGFRLEAEGSYFKNDIDKVKSGSGSSSADGSVDMKALMVNALWEFENETKWFSYLGLGGGYGWSKGKTSTSSASASVPLFQPILGAGYRITENISMALDYKFMMGLKKLDYDGVKGEYKAHRLGLGVRYAF